MSRSRSAAPGDWAPSRASSNNGPQRPGGLISVSCSRHLIWQTLCSTPKPGSIDPIPTMSRPSVQRRLDGRGRPSHTVGTPTASPDIGPYGCFVLMAVISLKNRETKPLCFDNRFTCFPRRFAPASLSPDSSCSIVSLA
jgi:hypothetical protein